MCGVECGEWSVDRVCGVDCVVWSEKCVECGVDCVVWSEKCVECVVWSVWCGLCSVE